MTGALTDGSNVTCAMRLPPLVDVGRMANDAIGGIGFLTKKDADMSCLPTDALMVTLSSAVGAVVRTVSELMVGPVVNVVGGDRTTDMGIATISG